MRRWSALPRPFLATLFGVFALVAILYGFLWMYAVRYPCPVVELGFNQLHNPDYDARREKTSTTPFWMKFSKNAWCPAANDGIRAA
jgi:hypothetical protein